VLFVSHYSNVRWMSLVAPLCHIQLNGTIGIFRNIFILQHHTVLIRGKNAITVSGYWLNLLTVNDFLKVKFKKITKTTSFLW
jgi:hypothetical protein